MSTSEIPQKATAIEQELEVKSYLWAIIEENKKIDREIIHKIEYKFVI